MRPAVLLFTLLCSLAARADEFADRAGVQTTIAALNDARRSHDGKALDAILATGMDPAERALFLSFEERLTAPARRPMSEEMLPQTVARKISFLTPDIAVADVSNTAITAIWTNGAAASLILRREASGWKIALLRGPVLGAFVI